MLESYSIFAVLPCIITWILFGRHLKRKFNSYILELLDRLLKDGKGNKPPEIKLTEDMIMQLKQVISEGIVKKLT